MKIILIIVVIVIAVRIIKIIKEKRQQKEKRKKNDALLDAVSRGDKQTVQKLIAEGIDINYIFGYPLQIAVENHDKEMVALLIANGVDGNYGGALVTAVKKGDKEMVSFLIEKGAKVNLEYDGKLPLDFAQNNEIITILKDHGAKTKFEIDEAKKEQDKFDIDFVSAVRRGDIENVKCLIPQISNIDIVIPGHELEAEVITSNGVQKETLTPLMYAADYYDIEMVKVLVENGANVNAKDSHGRNALMYAVFRHDVRMIDFLACEGANVNVKSFNDLGSGITPLMVATNDGNIETVAALIKKGADVQAQTSKGTTALSVAKSNRFAEIENLLRKSGARY